jgi:translation initiation factor 3 subunit G
MYNDKMNEAKAVAAPAPETTTSSGKPGKYIPPYLKDNPKGMAGGMRGGRDDTPAIRISNLSESMVESDLEELVKKIGPHSKMYLARDKVSVVI